MEVEITRHLSGREGVRPDVRDCKRCTRLKGGWDLKWHDCTFRSYLSLDAGGPPTQQALKDGKVRAADVFTTDPSIEDNNLVALADPKSNFAAQNIVPLINSAKATDQVKQVLNAISAKLTTQNLIDLNRKLNAPDKPDPSTVAKEWLSANGLG